METKLNNEAIQKEIIEIITKKKVCPFGDLVKEMDYTYDEILANIVKLKEQGRIKKLNSHQGYFSLV